LPAGSEVDIALENERRVANWRRCDGNVCAAHAGLELDLEATARAA
jgi:hypothetical protein